MAQFDFILQSGAKLHVNTAPFEDAVTLVEAIKKVTFGMDTSVELSNVVFATPEVRKALYPVFRFALYENMKVSPTLFDDPKWGDQARGDYFEICAKLIDVNCKPFFLKSSTESLASSPPPTKSQKQTSQ